MLARWIDFAERLGQHFRRLQGSIEASAPVAAKFRHLVKRSNDFWEPLSKALEDRPAAHIGSAYFWQSAPGERVCM